MKKNCILKLTVLLLTLLFPVFVNAVQTHLMGCTNCHKAGANFASFDGNACVLCHTSGSQATFNDSLTHPVKGYFEAGDASDAIQTSTVVHGAIPGKEISHMWQRMNGSNVPEVGAQEPTTYARQFNGRYGITRGRLLCFRCHDPHADATTKASLLKVPVDADQICSDCHLPWYQNNANALLTHPVGSGVSYNSAAADATKFNASITNVNNGDIRKVAGFVSCTSCHGVHSVDSNSATVDGYANYTSLSGDGHLLRSDGPRDLAAVTEADFTQAEAQLKSNLCQACHVYKLHGKVDDGAADRFLGCLDCHSGHAYNNNDPYYFVLRKNSYNPITNSSVSFTGYNFGGFDYIYNNPAIFGLLNRTEVWKDNSNLTALGYCETCHGEAEAIPKGALFHSSTDDCATCHLHNSTGWAYSFQNDASAATCGDCHGFPPYKNQPGDRTGSGVDGGYAYISAAWNYAHTSVTYFKDESTTPHNAHAAGGTTQGATSDYIFGTGVYACEPCHENFIPTHQQESTLPYTTGFRNINFYANVDRAGATYDSGTNKCSALYCHSNGAPRTGDGPTRNYATGTVATPAWANGKGTIIGKTNPTHECAFCHGNTAATMNTKGNSAAHAKHLDRYGNDCSICHNQTAVNSTTLASGANRIDLLSPASGGKHVNTLYDIVYKTSGSVLYNALGTNDLGVNYDATTGTCSVYCHDPADLGTTADWDAGVGGAACGSCHGVTSATLTTNSHAIHIDLAGANISCDACHGAGASTAVHSGHVDGVVTQLTVAASCDLCHGVEGADTSPIWGNSGSIDCLTCHTGASVTSYTDASAATVTAPAKTMADISGHNRPTASDAYPVTGSPAANKTCTTCHLTAINADHVGGAATKLLQVAFTCEDCHTATGSRSAEATLRVQTHSNMEVAYTGQKRLDFAALCTACHDPHGAGSNIAMIAEVKADFLGSVVLYNVTGADSFDEADAANGDDICATCHTATVHNNQAASGTHHEGENCLTCHGHNGVNGGFMPTGGTACNDCHGNPPTASDDRPAGKAGVHAAHVNVATHEESEDKFDCEVCHPGAATFTLAHSDASVSLAAGITNGTCASACHLSTAGDGNWTDSNGLNCDACHYYAVTPSGTSGNELHAKKLTGTHSKHFDAGRVCTDCHDDNSLDTASPHTHIDDPATSEYALNNTNDGTVLQDRGAATTDEATVIVPTWDDGLNTCANTACHNPTGAANFVEWNVTPGSSCDLCHMSNPTTGSHQLHLSAAAKATFGKTIVCNDCHADNSANYAHLDGTVGLNGFAYTGNVTEYTSATFGRCTTTTCHNDGTGAVAVQTPVWGRAPQSADDCTNCHMAPPNSGRHAQHVANTGLLTASCGECHLAATATTYNSVNHFSGSPDTGNKITGGTLPQCANTCHAVDATGTWADANPLECVECHASGKIGTDPASGLHVGPLTVSGNPHDISFKVTRNEATPSGTCTTCHSGIDLLANTPVAHAAGGAPNAAEIAIASAINYTNAAPSTCAPTGALATCHDDGGAWSRKWNATARNTDDSQCGNCHGDFDYGWAGGVIQRHSADAQVEAGHDGTDKCYMCHTYKKGVTVPYNFAVKHRDGTIQINNDMVFVDSGAAVNTCNGCHDSGAGPYGTGDGQYGFIDTNKDDTADGGVNRWSREMVNGGPVGNCNGCHVSFGRTHAGTNESAAVHTYHTGSPMSPGCGACHPADSGPGGALHENNTVDFGGTYLTTALNYTGADFTNTNCSTANGCHNSDNNSWAADSLATCADCHAATGKLLNQGGYPPTSNAHSAHLGNAAYVGTVGVNACDPCHGTGSSVSNNLSTHNDGDVDVLYNTVISAFNATEGTCTNSCHSVVSGRDWNDGGTLACVDCHLNAGDIGKDNKDNTSGLHQSSGVGVERHDDAFATSGTCISCHTSIDLTTTSHADGVTTDPNTSFGLFGSYDTGASTCSGAGVATACHTDLGDWTRKWNGVVDAKPLGTDDPTSADVCGNCHGTFYKGWNSLSASHVNPDTADNATDEMQAGGHEVCQKCHGWGNANYNETWLGSSNINYAGHGDGHITMNGPVGTGTGYNPVTGGCDTINCHGAKALEMNTNSGWTVNYGDFGGAGACGSCHSGGKTPATSSGAHDAHGASLSDQTTCYPCHPNVDYSAGHGATGTFVAGITYSDNGTPGSNAAADDTCATTICHSAAGNAAVWGVPTSVDCTSCHYYSLTPTAGGNSGDANALSVTHEAHFAKTKVCSDCHTVDTGQTAYPNRTHIDGGTSALSDRANAALDEATVLAATLGTGSDPDPGAATCAGAGVGLGCHNTKTTPAWGSSATCSSCHTAGGAAAADPSSGLHAITPTVSSTTHDGTLAAGNCINCHNGTTPSSLHQDGTLQNSSGATFTFHGNVTAYSASGCNATCHSDAGDWARQWSTTAANSDGAECGNCHGGIGVGYAAGAWVSGIAPDHLNNWDGDGNGPEVMTSHSVCKSCHGFNGAADKDDNYLLTMHRNNLITMNGGTNYNEANWGCDNAGCHGGASVNHALADSGWTVELGSFAAGGDCWGCHGNGSSQYWPDGTVYPDRAGVHIEHIVAIVEHMAGGDTLANRNATCIYCHPGGVHSGDQSAAPADVSNTDTNNDGVADLNIAAKMKKIVGGADDNSGFYRSTPATCSTVACHASAPFTPHWYTDTVAPGDVTLTAAAGPVPRSIKLTWTAVGDDGTLDGTAYKYDVRMGTTSAIATNFGLTTNHAQGVPTVKRKGTAQEAIIHGVDPSTTYYFALRTYDVTGNYGGTANGGGYVSYAVPASADTTPPVLTGSPTWYGLDSAKALDAAGTVALSWTRAEDHSMPITYDVWWSTATITYGAPQASTGDTHFRVTGLTDGQTYNFAVRARDAYGNTDTNTIVLQAIPQGLSTVPKADVNYYANGTATTNIPMLADVHTTNGTTATLPAVFIGPTTFAATTDIFASGFSLNIVNSNAVTTLRAELGYITGASTFNSFSTALWASDQTVAKRATRLVTFKFNGAQRQMTATMNAKLGVRVSVTAGAVTSIGWGPTSKGGILSFATQPINTSPTAPTVSSTVSGANASIWWAASTDTVDGVADTVHYDVYGSANGGTDGFPYIIATGLTINATVGTPLVWDTQAAGIALGAAVSNVQVRVEAGDVINGKVLSHTAATSSNLAVNNSGDNVAPGAIAHFKAETRPKQGSVYLSWTAPGDDGANNGRAAAYDIRLADAIIDTGIKYNAATQLDSEPYPDFGGNGQGYEVLNLAAGSYYFAIKAFDEGGNASPLAYTAATVDAGPKCGICHSTPPDETATIGNHARHGYTIAECANCHGSEAANFTTSHQDGVIKLGWKTASPVVATTYNSGYIYTYNSLVIYKDADGSGGFNATGDNMDDGSCGNWSTLNVSGCHGPAVSATWTADATLSCSACHGDNNRVLDQYSHSFDDPSDDVKAAPPVDNHGYDGTGATEAERKYVGAHVSHLNSSFRMSKGDSCRLCHGASRPGNSIHADGIIDVDLDLAAAGASAVWTEGTPTTAGSCSSMSPESCHPSTATPTWDSAAVFYCTNCHGMGGVTPSHVTDPNKNIADPDNDPQTGDPMPGNCTWCHVGGHPKDKKVIAITNASPAVVTTEHNHNLAGGEKVSIHTTTGMTEINNHTYNTAVINATQFSLVGSDTTGYGTFDNGSWIEGNGTGIILIPNDSRVGINYLSGGVHLKANIGARGEVSSEAELCWSCHTPNSISEWGGDDGATNTVTDPGNGNVYNFGTLNQANWIGATWTSGTTGTYGFSYKTGIIRSTHSTDATGTSALTGSAYAYTNGGVDAVGKIHCSNCHDVHNSNTSPLAGDSLDPTGPPYLRGTWKSNPYKEDGAPQLGQTYTAQITAGSPGYGYGAVPRANPSTTQAMGGYWIDQNSGNPTSGWTYESSAALCQLCHSTSVNDLDQTTGENLWISATNGHANSVLGGSGEGAANIFLQGVAGGRNGTIGALGGSAGINPNVGGWMGFQNTSDSTKATYGYGPRSTDGGYLAPLQTPTKVTTPNLTFAWGNSVDATTVESGYHQFSCSKCHNPHASRLPKLMITNCLDVTHNTWEDDYSGNAAWASFGTTTSSWGTTKLSHLSTAQNCHRMIDLNGDNTPDEKGWNKVTPW